MSNPTRDTQFLGFAQMLYGKLVRSHLASEEDLYKIIAQQAYDFACHVFDNTNERMVTILDTEEAVCEIPDMTASPQEK